MTCQICGWQPATRRGRCNACRLFLRRHGRDKTAEEVMRGYERALGHLERVLAVDNRTFPQVGEVSYNS